MGIESIENGPLVISDAVDVVGEDGNVLDCSHLDRTVLCRCGQSNKQPLCDGTHKKCGFSSANENGQQSPRLHDYQGEQVSVSFNKALCVHAARCVTGLPSVFNPTQRPWVQPDAADVERVREVVASCPTGALQCSGGGVDNTADARITIVPGGPLLVEHVDFDGGAPPQHATSQRYALCRCGASKNKPYCDGSHHSLKAK